MYTVGEEDCIVGSYTSLLLSMNSATVRPYLRRDGDTAARHSLESVWRYNLILGQQRHMRHIPPRVCLMWTEVGPALEVSVMGARRQTLSVWRRPQSDTWSSRSVRF
eukprot:COSAG02_NODE_32281_length_519_cov_0.521429_1_plen_106_part_01